jgi:hypothetical protein
MFYGIITSLIPGIDIISYKEGAPVEPGTQDKFKRYFME